MEMRYEVTFSTVVSALKHQWKTLLACVLAFALVGAGAGVVYADRLAAPAAGTAETLAALSFESQVYDQNYYTTCYNALNRQNENVIAYIQTLSAEQTLSSEQKAALADLLLAAKDFKSVTLPRIYSFKSQPDRLFVPSKYYDDLLLEYTNALASTEQNLVVSAQAVELLEEMQSPSDLSRDNVADAYLRIVNSASEHSTNLINKARFETYIDLLTNHADQVTRDTRSLEVMEEEALGIVNELTNRLNEVAKTVCEANHLNTSLALDKNSAVAVTVTHTHSEAYPRENFEIIFIFCTLVGICAGLFFAVWREEKKKMEMHSAAENLTMQNDETEKMPDKKQDVVT